MSSLPDETPMNKRARTASPPNENPMSKTATKKITYTFLDGKGGTLTVSDTWDKTQLRDYIASHYPYESYRIKVEENNTGKGEYTIIIISNEDWYNQFLNWLLHPDIDVSGVRYSEDKKDYSDQEKLCVQHLLRQFFVNKFIKKLNGTGIHLDLTSFYKHFGITSIKEEAFKRLCFFKSITIPDVVTSIGKYAFAHTPIESVVIPDSVDCIGPWAFYSCVRLTEVVLSSKLEHIEYYTFQNTKLQSVDIPRSVRTIQTGAFMNAQLTTVRFPESWNNERECDRHIAGGAFVQNKLLKEVSLAVRTLIGCDAFDKGVQINSVFPPKRVV